MQIGYCTNVHAGADLETTQSNLTEHALRVKSKHAPDSPMGIGLWLSANAAQGLAGDTQLAAFKDWLAENGLLPFTMNGFPFGDFHQEVVKHDVYRPTWADESRSNYTRQLIDILHFLLPDEFEGSISTLPICWPEPKPNSRVFSVRGETAS